MPVSQNSAAFVITRWREVPHVFVGILMKGMDRLVLAAFTIILALGGCIVGTVMGGIRGHTREAGIVDGAGKGAVTGAIAALELLDLVPNDDHHHPFSKLAVLSTLFQGKLLLEWVYPPYHCHIGTPETIYREVSDIFYVRGVPGLSHNDIQKLPLHQFNSTKMLTFYNESCCSICFQEFEEGEEVRVLPKCDHIFHCHCIDEWLIQQGSCPICRTCAAPHFDD